MFRLYIFDTARYEAPLPSHNAHVGYVSVVNRYTRPKNALICVSLSLLLSIWTCKVTRPLVDLHNNVCIKRTITVWIYDPQKEFRRRNFIKNTWSVLFTSWDFPLIRCVPFTYTFRGGKSSRSFLAIRFLHMALKIWEGKSLGKPLWPFSPHTMIYWSLSMLSFCKKLIVTCGDLVYPDRFRRFVENMIYFL